MSITKEVKKKWEEADMEKDGILFESRLSTTGQVEGAFYRLPEEEEERKQLGTINFNDYRSISFGSVNDEDGASFDEIKVCLELVVSALTTEEDEE